MANSLDPVKIYNQSSGESDFVSTMVPDASNKKARADARRLYQKYKRLDSLRTTLSQMILTKE